MAFFLTVWTFIRTIFSSISSGVHSSLSFLFSLSPFGAITTGRDEEVGLPIFEQLGYLSIQNLSFLVQLQAITGGTKPCGHEDENDAAKTSKIKKTNASNDPPRWHLESAGELGIRTVIVVEPEQVHLRSAFQHADTTSSATSSKNAIATTGTTTTSRTVNNDLAKVIDSQRVKSEALARDFAQVGEALRPLLDQLRSEPKVPLSTYGLEYLSASLGRMAQVQEQQGPRTFSSSAFSFFTSAASSSSAQAAEAEAKSAKINDILRSLSNTPGNPTIQEASKQLSVRFGILSKLQGPIHNLNWTIRHLILHCQLSLSSETRQLLIEAMQNPKPRRSFETKAQTEAAPSTTGSEPTPGPSAAKACKTGPLIELYIDANQAVHAYLETYTAFMASINSVKRVHYPCQACFFLDSAAWIKKTADSPEKTAKDLAAMDEAVAKLVQISSETTSKLACFYTALHQLVPVKRW